MLTFKVEEVTQFNRTGVLIHIGSLHNPLFLDYSDVLILYQTLQKFLEKVDAEEERMDVIGQNGNTGEHYGSSEA